jgi:signal transduction histidine kinase
MSATLEPTPYLAPDPRERGDAARCAELLLAAVRELSRARTVEGIAQVVKRAARALVQADGATFVLRDRGECYYLDEDAIEPLWKGQRFPADACVSGWVMQHGQQVTMQDIYVDPRVPHAAYRPTFVKSLVMTPVRTADPLAAIGIYWAHERLATAAELALLQDLADTTAVALENAEVYAELERRVRERTEQLTQVNQELEAFSYSVAHDLRSPLSAILGFAEIIEDRHPSLSSDQLASFAHEIVTAGKRMNSLIGALLEFSRSARAALDSVELDLSACAHAAAERLLAAVPSRALQLVIEPNLRVTADAALLDVLLTNLLSNAIKYTGKKAHARIELGTLSDPARGTVYFVRDDGAGFDPAHSERLFLPFQRLHTDREFIGSGIGLATVARIVKRHGGEIWAEGAQEQGATFYFTLPSS